MTVMNGTCLDDERKHKNAKLKPNVLMSHGILLHKASCLNSLVYYHEQGTYKRQYHDNMPVLLKPTHSPLLYIKNGVYSGIHYFFYFCSKTYSEGTR